MSVGVSARHFDHEQQRILSLVALHYCSGEDARKGGSSLRIAGMSLRGPTDQSRDHRGRVYKLHRHVRENLSTIIVHIIILVYARSR